MEELTKENAVLARALAAAQQRSTRAAQEQGRKIEQLQAQAVQLRAALIARDTLLSQARDALAELERHVPHLPSRNELARRAAAQLARIQDLERLLARERERGDRLQRLLPSSSLPSPESVLAPSAPRELPVGLAGRAVLWVSSERSGLPVCRQLVEGAGGRFLHHDGGDGDNVSQLDQTLAAADVVICQAGCISHDACWRVKDHCKRTGKGCAFIERPNHSGLRRALDVLHVHE